MSSTLPIRKLTLYKHGLGSFERSGAYQGHELRLSFPRRAMNDVLKSLIAIDRKNPGAILGLSFETPPDRNSAMHKALLSIDPHASLLDLLTALRGRQISVSLHDASQLSGAVLGVQNDVSEELIARKLLLKTADDIRVIDVSQLTALRLDDDVASADLEHLLRAARSDEEREQTLLKLTPGDHDLHIAYIAPAPAWRVSYRLVLQTLSAETEVLLQAWGLFDNTLDEDLDAISLSLVAGMPVSFQYLLHAPNTPDRPVVQDDARTVNAPIHFDAPVAAMAAAPMAAKSRRRGQEEAQVNFMMAESTADFSQSLAMASTPVAEGDDRGALFAYNIATPVSVGRGQSAMVPLLAEKLKGHRELLYNSQKHAKHPVASVRFSNASGLTLERGPLTVFDGANYAGEAVLSVTANGADVIVAYAVELGISISTQSRFEQRRFALLVQNGGLYQQDWQYRITEYELQSKRKADADVTIEHPRTQGYEIDNAMQSTPTVVEAAFARWSVKLAGFARATLCVSERVSVANRIELDQLPNELLEEYIRTGQINAMALQKLRAAYAIRTKLQPILQRYSMIQQRRAELSAQQQRLRENLTPLKDTGPEAALRARFAGELSKVEDAMQALNEEEAKLIPERDRLITEQQQALS